MYSPRVHKRTSSGTQPESAGEYNGSEDTLYFKLAFPSSSLQNSIEIPILGQFEFFFSVVENINIFESTGCIFVM